MGLVPKTTKSEVKFFGGLTMSKIIGIVACGGAGLVFGAALPSALQILLSVVLIILFFICTSKAPSNPKKTFIKGLLEWLTFLFCKKRFYGVNTSEYADLERREEINAKKRKAKKDKQN